MTDQRKTELRRRSLLLSDVLSRPFPGEAPDMLALDAADFAADVEFARLRILAGARESSTEQHDSPSNVIDLAKHRRCQGSNANQSIEGPGDGAA